MQFLVSVIDDGQAAAANDTNSATQSEAEAVDAFNDRLQADGHWVFAAGVSSPSEAVVVDARGGSVTHTDGPFVATDEYMAGFWIMDASDLDTMTTLAEGASTACNRKIEVRRIL